MTHACFGVLILLLILSVLVVGMIFLDFKTEFESLVSAFAAIVLSTIAIDLTTSIHNDEAQYLINLQTRKSEIVQLINDSEIEAEKNLYTIELEKIEKKITHEQKYMSVEDWEAYKKEIKKTE